METLKSFRRIKTKPVRVQVVMNDASVHVGALHVQLDERLQDLLNGDKPFLPLRRDLTDEIVLLSRQYIVWAAEIADEEPAETDGPTAGG